MIATSAYKNEVRFKNQEITLYLIMWHIIITILRWFCFVYFSLVARLYGVIQILIDLDTEKVTSKKRDISK